MESNIIIDPKYNWKNKRTSLFTIYYIGRSQIVSSLENVLPKEEGEAFDLTSVNLCLQKFLGNFSVIIDGGKWVFAATDKIRSFPVFYSSGQTAFYTSNSAKEMQIVCELNTVEETSFLEFQMAGYVTGSHTLYKDLSQLQAAESLLWDKEQGHFRKTRYYTFFSKNVRKESEDDLVDELEDITNRAFRRVIDDLNGRPVVVPLSGGLDSRLIVCKLQELGYDNLQTYSYGPPGNYEAKIAQIVAQKLGVPWSFIPTKRKTTREFYWTEQRRAYSEFAANLCSIPVIQDLPVLVTPEFKKRLCNDSVFINGQSGDFITGGHIPEKIAHGEGTLNSLLEMILAKHFTLWRDLATEENNKIMQEKIVRLVKGELGDLAGCRLDQIMELWEWQERQCKYVVNCVRLFEYSGYEWQLPLWCDEYLFFWREIPVRLKLNQYLYKKYLERYDYKKVFKGFKHTIWRWPGATIAAVPVAQLVGLLGGRKAKDAFYDYMKYFGHYSFLYGAYPYSYFLRHSTKARNPISFFVKTWVKENTGRQQI